MQILLTFDVEVWCGGWDELDQRFPRAYERYVYGRSRHGDFGLPRTLEVLDRHDLKGVFFVEPLFSARFGAGYLAEIVDQLHAAGQEVQLHLHPEWVDEISPPPIANASTKRQHLRYYTLEEQEQLVALGIDLLCQAGTKRPIAFRAGSFAADENTYRALAANGIRYDSSLNPTMDDSAPDLRGRIDFLRQQVIHDVWSCPMSVFRDGRGRSRHAQVGACSSDELIDALGSADGAGWPAFVLLSHSFELLRPGRVEPDRTVVRRFERLCRALAEHREDWPTTGFETLDWHEMPSTPDTPQARLSSTLVRYTEQLARRLV